MSMDYGDAAAPNPEGRMGAYAIQSAQSTYAQALSAGITNPRIGVIPMVGERCLHSRGSGSMHAFESPGTQHPSIGLTARTRMLFHCAWAASSSEWCIAHGPSLSFSTARRE